MVRDVDEKRVACVLVATCGKKRRDPSLQMKQPQAGGTVFVRIWNLLEVRMGYRGFLVPVARSQR